jgi:hypothetical protein
MVNSERYKNGYNDKFTADQMIRALSETKGMITLAAQKLDCAPNTVRRYIREYPTIAQAQKDARDKMTDAVELKLYEKIMSGDTTAMIFYLKTQAKERGYIERQEVTGADGTPLMKLVIDAGDTEP